MLYVMVKLRCFFLLLFTLLFSSALLWAQSADQLYAGGRQAFTDGLWQTASSQFSRLLREYPEDLRADSAAYMGAVAYYNDGEYQNAIDVLVLFPRRYPDSPWNQRVAYWEGLARYEKDDWSRAASAFEKQTRITEDRTYRERSLLYLGACWENLDNLESAERIYTTLIDEGRDRDLIARAVFRLGQIRLSDKRPDEALDAFTLMAYDYSSSPLAVDIEYWIAESRRRMGQDEKALDSYRNFLSTVYSSPYRSFALLEAARLASNARYDDEALAYLDLRDEERSPGPDEGKPSVLRIRAASYMRTGQISEARSAYTGILKDPLDDDEAQTAAFNLAQTWLGGSSVLSAVPYLEQAGNGPDGRISADSLYLAGTILLHSGNSRGVVVLERFASENPQDNRREEALRLAVKSWRDENDSNRAVEVLNLLVRDYPQSENAPSYLFLRGEIALESGDSSSALRDYGRITREYNDSDYALESNSRIGFIYSDRKEFVRAAGYYQAAADLAGGVHGGEKGRRALYSTAVAYLNGGRADDAVRLFDSLVQSEPSGPWSVEAAFHMGEALYDMEDYPAARRAYEITTRYGDSDWVFEAFYGIGWTWFRELNWGKAAGGFNKAADAAVNSEQKARALYRVGLSLASEGNWENALTFYDKALSPMVGNWREEALYQKSWALLNLNRLDEAGETAGMMADEFPDSELPPDLPFRMGENAMKAGEYAEAVLWYDRCRNDFPDSDIAVQADLRGALAVRAGGDAGAAAERYGAWVVRRPDNPGAASAARSWAEALKAAGNPDAASEALKQVSSLDTGNNSLSSPIVLAWARIMGIPPESRELLENLAGDESLPSAERAEALLLTAHRYRMDGSTERSRQLYEVLIRDVPGRIGAEAQEGVARSFAEEGKPDEAAEAYLAVPYLFPEQTDLVSRALREAERLYREAGREDEADKIHSRIQ
ncbi:MAG: hypothetical protein DRP70_01190 [Spirochaetes bacterium]|nr:MAG: hypothetical protein DRP70_01190 [Spirochaetota bacterium]